jgi:NAD(P)-dependent dehydrogenase (short-subunit alcohol dehydrogenase family)
VNVVAPGAIKTPIWKRGPRASASEEDSAKLAKFFSSAVPQGRWGEPEEVAKAVLFLASDDSSYVNAVELMVDGGVTGAPFGAPIILDVFTPPAGEAKSAKAHAGGGPQ